MIDLGDPWPDLAVTIYNAAGAAEDATLVVLTIGLPDGTSATPTVTSAGSGVYTASYTPTQGGRHTARWVATGVNASAFTDAIDVDEAVTGLVSLADARAHLNMTLTTNDEELRHYIDCATEYVEGEVGPVVRRTITKTIQPLDGKLFLDGPAISLTTITAAYGSGGTYPVGDFFLDGANGVVHPPWGSTTFCYPVTVTYVGGRVIVPAKIRKAALDYIKWAWESQRGASPMPLPGGEGQVPSPADVPYKIKSSLRAARVFGFA